MMSEDLIYYFNNFFLIYGLILFGSYVLIGILSSYELIDYSRRNSHFRHAGIAGFKKLPSISIIAPCFNEEKSIVENVRSLLLLYYPDISIIIINDGSTDKSLDLIIDKYELVKVQYAYHKEIITEPVRAIYKSKNNLYSNLIVVDKANGGKADALNAGLNISRSKLFLAVDVDCIIEQDALFRMVKPFLEEDAAKKVIASGGVIRVANSCEIRNGQVAKVQFPNNIWAGFQVLEYFRAFTLGRMAWGRVNSLLIISGAFGLFDKKIAMLVGGYDKSTVGEDFELVVKMRNYMNVVEKVPYKVAFIPDPLCWTEVPANLNTLFRQRNRWTRGLIDTLIKHRGMFMNPRHGFIGMIGYPYWVFFEWLAPIIELTGLIYFVFLILAGWVNINMFLFLFFMVFVFALAFSSFAVFYETFVFNRYRGIKFLTKVSLIAIFEVLIYHPLNLVFSISGNIDYFFRGKKKKWGSMKRRGFAHGRRV